MFSQRTALRRAVAPVIEHLDARRLLAFSTLNGGGTLSAAGTSGNDAIAIERSGTSILVKRNGVTESHPASKVQRVWAKGFAGHDAITVKTNLRATLLGEAGNDSLYGNALADSIHGGTGADQIYAGGGNDTVVGGLDSDSIRGGEGDDQLYGDEGIGAGNSAAGRDSLYGEGGNDSFYNGYDGADRYEGGDGDDRFEQIPGYDVFPDAGDTFVGGAGTDSISYIARQIALRITLDNAANDGAAGERDDVRSDIENVTGGEEADYIVGTSANNVLDAGPVYFDLDTVIGGAGHDTLVGGLLDGGTGNDVMDGGTYDYSSRVAPLSFVYNEAAETYTGGQAGEVDTFYFSFFYDNELLLGSGNDKVSNIRGFVVHGGAGNDTLSGGLDNVFGFGNAFYGEAGNDLITSESYAYIEGGLGNDTMSTSDAADSTLAFAYSTTPVLISYDGNNSNDGPLGEKDVIALDTFEAVIGGQAGDVLTGDNGNNFFVGGGGNDLLVGKGGDDTLDGDTGDDSLNGGLGNDYFYGGNGIDTVDYSDRTQNLTIKLNSDVGGNGAAGEDDYYATDLEVVRSGSGHDAITGNVRHNTIYGGAGNDTIRGEAGSDSLLGEAGNDFLYGGLDNDTLRGGAGSDFLSGEKGNDRHFGEADNDTIFAKDSLVDIVDGGTGTDRATYDSGAIVDQILSIETKA